MRHISTWQPTLASVHIHIHYHSPPASVNNFFNYTSICLQMNSTSKTVFFMAISLTVMDCSCNFTIVHFSDIISVYFADVNNRDKSGKTPLHTAILSKQFRIVDRLLECGADVTITDDAGDTALHTAIHVGSEKLVLVSMRSQSQKKWFTSIIVTRSCDLFRQQLNRTLCQHRKATGLWEREMVC